MSRHHRHHDVEVAAQLFGWFLLAGGVLWLITVTYGTVLLPVSAALWLYRRKTGRWPGRKPQAVRVVYRGEHEGVRCPHQHTRPGLARQCSERMRQASR